MEDILIKIMADIKQKINNIDKQIGTLDKNNKNEILAFEQQKHGFEESLLIVADYFNKIQ